ncbi:MAG: DUF3990 domain-containing protein [Bacteroidales bacterium]|jgi:hypothetical protein|nr:DUF3990 domain-containing protein [Bacteroidales bacterium]
MKVYHGSYTPVVEIDLSHCEPRKDFGVGFYVTRFKEQAENWAFRKGNRKHTNGFITEFEFDENTYDDKNFNVLRFEDYSDEWFDFVIKNRKSLKITHDYDIVEGPVADDKIQRELDMFLRNEISRNDFFGQLVYPKQNHQICFCTLNSLQMLDYIDYKMISGIEIIGEKVVEMLIRDKSFTDTQAADVFYTSAVFTQLADLETKFFLKSWQEIYEILKKEIFI